MSSFFGKKTTNKERLERGHEVRHTGGKIDYMVEALIGAANDKKSTVKDAIENSLSDIGLKQPNLVLSTCLDFVVKKKCTGTHRVIVFRKMNAVSQTNLDSIERDLAASMVAAAATEMTSSKDIKAELMNSSEELLVTLGKRFPEVVMTELNGRFEQGKMPHYFVMKALGDFANVNALAIAPYLYDILQKTLPLLSSIKHDNLRWVFCAALGHFAEAIRFYDANKDQAVAQGTTSTVNSLDLSPQMFTAFDFISNNWIGWKESLVRLASVHALGHIAWVIPCDQLQMALPRIIPTVLALYRKEKDHYPISQGLSLLLEAVCSANSYKAVMEELLPTMLPLISAYVAAPVSYDDPSSVKNHAELLRCFETLATSCTDPVLSFFLAKAEAKDAVSKVGMAVVLKHLISRLEKPLEEKKPQIVAGVRSMLGDPNLQVRAALSQLVITMASKGYLNLVGGQAMIEFVIAQISISDEEIRRFQAGKHRATDTSPQDLQSMALNILNLITTTLPHMTDVLWPFLLEHVCKPEYTVAVGPICKSIHHLVTKLEEADELVKIDFEKNVNLPKPEAIITRLLVLLADPFARRDVGVHVLEALQSLSPLLHPDLVDNWDDRIPRLVQYLQKHKNGTAVDEEGEPTFKLRQWEETVLRWFGETLGEVNDEKWSILLGQTLVELYPLSAPGTLFRAMHHRLLGRICQSITHKGIIREFLTSLFSHIDHNSYDERQGAALGFGFCAIAHLDLVLEKLDSVAKNDMVRKSTGLFGLSKDKSTADVVSVTNTAVNVLGVVTLMAPPQLMSSRVDVNVLNILHPYFQQPPSSNVKLSLIYALEQIARAMHPQRIGSDQFVLDARDELIGFAVAYMGLSHPQNDRKGDSRKVSKSPPPPKYEQLSLEMLSSCLKAARALLSLPPIRPVDHATWKQVLDSAIQLFNLPKEKEEVQLDGSKVTCDDVIDLLNELLAHALSVSPTIPNWQGLLGHISPHLTSPQPHVRERALDAVVYVNNHFIQLHALEGPPVHSCTLQCGHMLGALCARATDPHFPAREIAIEGIQTMLHLDKIIRGGDGEDAVDPEEVPEDLAKLDHLRDMTETDVPSEIFQLAQGIGAVLAVTVDDADFVPLLHSLVESLTDAEVSSGNGACVVLNYLFKHRGNSLVNSIPSLVAGIREALERLATQATINGTLHCIRALYNHHLIPVLSELLNSPLPFSENVVKMLQVVARDEALLVQTLEYLIDILNNSPALLDVSDPKKKKKAPVYQSAPRPMAATAALTELLKTEEIEDVIDDHYWLIMATLSLRIGAVVGQNNPDIAVNPTEQCIECLKTCLQCTKDDPVIEVYETEGLWEKLAQADGHVDGLITATVAFCREHPDAIVDMFKFVTQFVTREILGQRVCGIALIGAFITACESDILADISEHEACQGMPAVQVFLNCLLSHVADKDLNIRLYCLRGLGNVVSAGAATVNRLASPVMSALLSAIDDSEDSLAMEAMASLSRIFELVDPMSAAPMLVNICLRIKPAFVSDNPDIRRESIALFGTLHRFGRAPGIRDTFVEQIHTNFALILCHLNEDDDGVKTACKAALKKLVPLFDHAGLTQLVAECSGLGEDEYLHYESFIESLALQLVEAFPTRISFHVMNMIGFFQAKWDTIKANAAYAASVTLRAVPFEHRQLLPMDTVSNAFVALLRESKPEVRLAAAIGIALLYDY